MKSSARLESAVFQLTPTRTRFDLVITANGKTESIASGLLNPFLAHLKSAQEQIGRGGYSIILEPYQGSDATWFTKGTVERFVRFVSTPEILERVYTIESEISQIEEAISLQRNNGTELHGVKDQVNYKESSEAKPRKPNNHDDASKSGSKVVKLGNEEKAIVLYKPDALAPETEGLNMHGENSKTQLLRVLETRKGVLQKEQGMAFARALAAGFDIDHIAPLLSFSECFGAARMMEACSRFVDLWKAKHESGQWVEAVEALKEPWAQDEVPSENNDMKPQMDNHRPPLIQEHLVGQFPHHSMYPHWPVHPQAGQMPVYQAYPLPMPYYQNYPGNGTFFQPPYPSVDDSGLSSGQIVEQRDHSMNNGELDIESTIYHDSDTGEDSQRHHQVRKKGGKSARKKSGTVVIRNINYIASKKQQSSDSGSQLSTASEDNDDNDINAINKNLKRSKREGNERRSSDAFKQLNEEDYVSERAGDDGHWQAFQTLLLRNADEEDNSGKGGMFAMEERALGKRQQTVLGNDPSIIGRQQNNGDINNYHDMSGDMTRKLKPSHDGMLTQRGVNTGSADNHLDIQFAEMGGGTNAYRQTAAGKADESYIVPCRSTSIEQVEGNGRMAIDMDSELPLDRVGSENLTGNYEPYDLNMMPNRDTENGTVNFDPAMDYELQAAKVDGTRKSADVKKGTKKVDTALGLKSQKKTTTVTKRGMPAKLSPAEEARARAERLRSFKADLQKQKKAMEEEQLKRLEALKIERQKRIAARNSSGGTSARSPLPSPQAKKPMPTRLSPVSQKGSKFSDTEPGSASPLQRSTVKSISRLSGDAHKTSRPGRLDFSGHSGGNRLTRSASPLTGRKEENNPSTPPGFKVPIAKIRRLSEPKVSSYPASSITSPSEKSKALSRRTSKGPELKKTPAIVKSDISKSTALPESESGENRITRSASSLSDRKEEKSGSKPDPKMSRARIRRLSEPKGSSYLASSVTPPSEKTLSRKTSKVSEMKQTPVIFKSEIIKSKAVPETNTKESNALSEVAKKRSAVKEPTQKMNTKIKCAASSSLIGDSNRVSSKNDYDEKTVVEKTVVMLECEKSPLNQASEEMMHIQSLKPILDRSKGKSSESVPVRAQSSPSKVKEINDKTVEHQLRKASPSSKVGAACPEKVLPNISSINVTEKSYNAPYARVSSLEHPCMEKSEYTKAPPTSFDVTTAGSEVTIAHVSSSMMTAHVSDDRQHKLDKIWEVSEKPAEKESSKGFKRLLKFGRKKHGSGSESRLELDHQSNHDEPTQDNASNVASSGEGITLKELISQGEGSTAQTTPQKSSRSFSLLSPFRCKAQHRNITSNKTEG